MCCQSIVSNHANYSVAKKLLVFFLGVFIQQCQVKTRKRGRSSQTTETVHCTRRRAAGKNWKIDNPLTARDIPQVTQAVVDSLRDSSSRDSGITGADKSPCEPCTGPQMLVCLLLD